jgi:hypothetical protein
MDIEFQSVARRSLRIDILSRCGKLINEKRKPTTDLTRIVLDPTILAGKPVIRGTRIAVGFIIGLLADG